MIEGKKTRAMDERSIRAFEELMASFAYKGKGNKNNMSIGCCHPPATNGKITGAVEGPETPPPRLQHRSRPRISAAPSPSPSPCPSSYIRAHIGGETVVVSKYFPLPPEVSDMVVIDKKEIERARKRKRKASSSSSSSEKKRRPRRKTQMVQEDDVVGGDGCLYQQPQQKVKRKKKKKKKRIQRTQLSAAEKKSDAYKRVGDYNTWEPPPSCHKLLQERYSFDPWRVLVICMLLNITTGNQVRKVLPGLFLLCPNAKAATEVPEEEIERVIQTLGLQRKRARMIKQFSREYLGSEWTHVTQLHGIGKYAADAYAIFCVGKPEAVVPEDHKLIDYWKFVCGKKDAEDSSPTELAVW